MNTKEIQLLTALKNGYHLSALERDQATELLYALTAALKRENTFQTALDAICKHRHL